MYMIQIVTSAIKASGSSSNGIPFVTFSSDGNALNIATAIALKLLSKCIIYLLNYKSSHGI